MLYQHKIGDFPSRKHVFILAAKASSSSYNSHLRVFKRQLGPFGAVSSKVSKTYWLVKAVSKILFYALIRRCLNYFYINHFVG